MIYFLSYQEYFHVVLCWIILQCRCYEVLSARYAVYIYDNARPIIIV